MVEWPDLPPHVPEWKTSAARLMEIEEIRPYSLNEVDQSGAGASVAALSPEERSAVDGRFISAFVRARKPAKQGM